MFESPNPDDSFRSLAEQVLTVALRAVPAAEKGLLMLADTHTGEMQVRAARGQARPVAQVGQHHAALCRFLTGCASQLFYKKFIRKPVEPVALHAHFIKGAGNGQDASHLQTATAASGSTRHGVVNGIFVDALRPAQGSTPVPYVMYYISFPTDADGMSQ